MNFKSTAITDSINGKMIEIVLNAKYESVVSGSNFAKAQAIKLFAQANDCGFCRILNKHVFISPVKGQLFSAAIEPHIGSIPEHNSAYMLYVPLDNLVYTVEIDHFGTPTEGTEQICSLDELGGSSLPVYAIKCGRLSEHFPDAIEAEGFNPFDKAYTFKPILNELSSNNYYASEHYLKAGAVAFVLMLGAYYLPEYLVKPDPIVDLFVPTIIPEPTATDKAVPQLGMLYQAVNDADYFISNGLVSIEYDQYAGLTLSGSYMGSNQLASLVNTAASPEAGHGFSFTANGWILTKVPEIKTRPEFNLENFNGIFPTIYRIAEDMDYTLYIDSPVSNIDRKTMSITLTKPYSSATELLTLAKRFEGLAATIESAKFNVSKNSITDYRLTMTMAGHL